MLSCALATKNEDVIRRFAAEASEHLSPEAQNAAKSAASIMAMNNVYYKFVGMMGESEYKTMPANLRMNVIANPGVDKVDFELWSLAVSAINGCQFCVQAHESILLKAGLSKKQIQTAVRIASVIQAVAATLSGEAALEGLLAKAA
jgi:alkyl hydroperoxide reductase subunit D